MGKKIVDADKFLANIGAMVETIEGRAKAFKRLVVSEVATGVMEQLQQRAPSDSDLPDDYKQKLEAVQVTGRPASYAVVYKGKAKVASSLDPQRTVLYINVLDANDSSSEAELFMALKRFQPFTMDTMPLDIPRDKGYVVAKRVSRNETETIRKRIARQQGAIQRVVDKVGQKVVSKRAFDKNSAMIFTDLAFQVMRKELGIGLSKKPHWRASLKHVSSGSAFFKKLQMSPESKRLWNDPNYNGWIKAGLDLDSVSESSVGDLEDFQDKISKDYK